MKKRLKIALLAPFEEPVPPEKYGGTELVVSNITETLVSLGYDVHLVATGDSKTASILHPVFNEALRKNPKAQDSKFRETSKYLGIGKVLEIVSEIKPDIIHNHIGWRLIPFEKFIGAPVVTTMHGPLETEAQRGMYEMFPNHRYISISNNQRAPASKLNFLGTVYNGIDISKFDFESKHGEYLAFLGRMSPEKGPKVAIEVAKKFGMKLIMAAKVDAVDKEYFKNEIEPLIDGKQIIFVGEVGPKEKNDLLKNAYALLATIQWREPFGLFLIEAMATGTPVVVTNMGAAPELVLNNKTGFTVDNDIDAYVEALKKIPNIKRKDCRKRVEENFTKEKMTEGYVKIYDSLI